MDFLEQAPDGSDDARPAHGICGQAGLFRQLVPTDARPHSTISHPDCLLLTMHTKDSSRLFRQRIFDELSDSMRASRYRFIIDREIANVLTLWFFATIVPVMQFHGDKMAQPLFLGHLYVGTRRSCLRVRLSPFSKKCMMSSIGFQGYATVLVRSTRGNLLRSQPATLPLSRMPSFFWKNNA